MSLATTESDRRELVQRLLAERKAKRHTATPSSGSSGSRTERYQRIQKLLGERRAKLELEESRDQSLSGLLSPGSASGFASEGLHNPAYSEGWGGSQTPLEFTPGGPRLEYSLDDPAHLIASQASGVPSTSRSRAGSHGMGARTLVGRHNTQQRGRASGALAGLEGPMLLTPQSTASEELIAPYGAGACRQLEWDAGVNPNRSDGASSTQPRTSRAERAERADMGSLRNARSSTMPEQGPLQKRSSLGDARSSAAPEPTSAPGPLQKRSSAAPELMVSEESTLQDCDHALQEIFEWPAIQLEEGSSAGEAAQLDLSRGGRPAEDQASQASQGGSACPSEESLPGKSTLLKQKLFEALRGTPEGPIELDPAMLYSPASSMQPPSSESGTPEQGRLADESAACSASQRRRSATVPRQFRLSRAHPSNSRAALAERILAGRRREAPFRPRAISRSASRGSGVSTSGTLEGDARLARLAQPRTQLWEKCAQKKQQEQCGALAECSFAPRTGRGPASGSRAAAAKLPATVRLYANHSSKYKQWDRLRAEQQNEELQQCTFTPSVNDSRDAHTPLHHRLEELQRQRRERLAKVQAAAQPTEGEETFSPAVNEKSVRMALSKQIRELHDEVPAYQRLGALRRPAPMNDHGTNEDLTFAPIINTSSTRLLEDSAQLPGSFLPRQRFFHDLRQQRMRILQAEDGSECTFSPKTEDQSRAILAASNKCDWLQQSSSDQVARLAVADKERIEGARAAAAHAYYSQFTFQPAINPKSRQLIRENRLAELASDDARRARLEASVAQVERERSRECTFQPALTSGPLRLPDQENQNPAAEGEEDRAQRLVEARSRKRAALEQQRSAREAQELAECSFAPARARKPPLVPKGPVKVHGMEQYMRKKQHARQLEQEQRVREQKAFILEPRRHLDACTIPQPFALQTELRELETAQSRAQLQAKILADSMKECTFQPKTNEALNCELLRAIMQEDDEDPMESVASASTL